jgi:O-antigen ligase
MSDRSPATSSKMEPKRRDAARQALLTMMIFIFVVAPLFITQSIVFLEPAQGLILLGVFAIIVIMLLPLHDRAVNMKPFFWGLIAYFALHVMWPRFLSVDVPLLPYISPIRLTLMFLLAAWVFLAATSSAVHDELWRRLKQVPVLSLFVLGLILFMALAIPFALSAPMSSRSFFDEIIELYLPFVVAVSLIRTRSNLEVFIRWLVVLGMITAVLLVLERMTHVNPFTTYLGPLANYDASWLEGALSNTLRWGTDTFRAKGAFLTPLSAAEYLVLALPFVFYWAEKTKSQWWRWTLIVSVPVSLAGIWATDTRTSIVTGIMVIGIYALVRGIQFLRAEGRSSLRPVIALALVGVIAAVAFGVTMILVKLNWQTAFGSEGSRVIQIEMGIPRIKHRPIIGYGPGMAAYILNYSYNGRDRSIDNYFLSVVLDSGLPGLMCFLGILVTMVVGAARRAIANPAERSLLMAFALTGLAFSFTRFTLSEFENLSLFYVILGAYVAAVRITSLDPEAAAALEAEPPRRGHRIGRRTIVGSARWRRQVRLR